MRNVTTRRPTRRLYSSIISIISIILLSIINDLYTEFILSGKKTHIILEGDQATYERLHSIRVEYGNESKWLIIFPGDWYFLKNYQEVLQV